MTSMPIPIFKIYVDELDRIAFVDKDGALDKDRSRRRKDFWEKKRYRFCLLRPSSQFNSTQIDRIDS